MAEVKKRRKMPGPCNRAKFPKLYGLAEHPSPTNRQVRSLGWVDARTRAGRIIKRFRQDLIAHVGGEPDVVQRAMIEQCCFMQLRLELMHQKIAENRFTEYDSKVHAACANSLNRALLKLGYQENVELARKRAERDLVRAYNKR
jgi:hypothetical protein